MNSSVYYNEQKARIMNKTLVSAIKIAIQQYCDTEPKTVINDTPKTYYNKESHYTKLHNSNAWKGATMPQYAQRRAYGPLRSF